jgi:hypothetical protein
MAGHPSWICLVLTQNLFRLPKETKLISVPKLLSIECQLQSIRQACQLYVLPLSRRDISPALPLGLVVRVGSDHPRLLDLLFGGFHGLVPELRLSLLPLDIRPLLFLDLHLTFIPHFAFLGPRICRFCTPIRLSWSICSTRTWQLAAHCHQPPCATVPQDVVRPEILPISRPTGETRAK